MTFYISRWRFQIWNVLFAAPVNFDQNDWNKNIQSTRGMMEFLFILFKAYKSQSF